MPILWRDSYKGKNFPTREPRWLKLVIGKSNRELWKATEKPKLSFWQRLRAKFQRTGTS